MRSFENRHMFELVVCCVVLFSEISVGRTSVVTKSTVSLQNNRFSGIVVAINPNVTEDSNLVDAIKTAWTEASSSLFAATRSRAYFGDITILVPSSWNSVAYDKISTGESYDAADVLVANPNPSYGDAPYTLQYGGCGSKGSYIHLTPNYLKYDYVSGNFGPRGKSIVHEWAHYRWGVFDETDDLQPFYDDPDGNKLTSFFDNQNLSYTQCSKDISVCCLDLNEPSYCRPGVANCKINPTTGVYSETCVCYLPGTVTNTDASIMAFQYVDQITTFCDDSPGSTTEHNKNAPNDQNRLCNLKSTWSVIQESPDFQAINPANPSISNVKPSFTVKKVERNRRFVLVLDVSGSMGTQEASGETRLQITNKAAANFIRTVNDGSYVGIVEFESSARTISNLKQVNAATDRDYLINKIPDVSGGGTCIGCGIDEAIDVLQRYGDPEGGYIIVMTDGQGSLDTAIANDAIAKGVIVETLIVYTTANDELVDLSLATGGSWFFASSDDLLALFDAYNDFADPKDGDVTTQKYEVLSETFKLDTSDPSHSSTINIDSTIGKETVFTYVWSVGTLRPDATLISPTGPAGSCGKIEASSGSSSCADILTDPTNKMLVITIKGKAQVGAWTTTVAISSSDAQTISIIATSKASGDGGEPIIAESSMEMRDGVPIAFAKVTQGLNPVLGADVIATVSVQGAADTNVNLYDAGADPDIRRNDGIYSRYITGIGTGRYSVKVRVESNYGGYNGTVIRSFSRQSRATYNPGYYLPNGTVQSNPNGATFLPKGTTFGISAQELGDFTRQASAGAFDYTESASDSLPPSKVLDLIVRQNDFNDFSKGIGISFTAPGDDYDSGTATRYEIRYTLGSPQELVNNFASANLFTSHDFIEGNISNPQVAGTTEHFVVVTPSGVVGAASSISIGIALKSYDNANNEAQISNVANLRYYITPPPFAVGAATTNVPTPAATTTDYYTTTIVQTISTNETIPMNYSNAYNDTTRSYKSTPAVLMTTTTPCKDCIEKDLVWVWVTVSVVLVGGAATAGGLYFFKYSNRCKPNAVIREEIVITADV